MNIEQWREIALHLAPALFFLIILATYYFKYFYKFGKHVSTSSNETLPISVIISARNERENLEKNIDSILTQDYTEYEVVVVNDCSFDGTADFLKNKTEENKHLKVVTVNVDERFQRGKKFALTMGIKAAIHERLVFTDADCKPASPRWLASLASSGLNDISLGYGPLVTNGGLIGRLVRYETFHTASQYFGYALAGEAYMGVARNLSYTKSTFFKNKGFASHQHILSGDDDLFVQENATSKNVGIYTDSDSFMISEGPSSIREFYKQKTRHMSTSKFYKSKFKRKLAWYSFSQLAFYLALIIGAILLQESWYLAFAVLALKWIIQYALFRKAALKLHAVKTLNLLPLLDVVYTLYIFTFAFIQPFAKAKKWN